MKDIQKKCSYRMSQCSQLHLSGKCRRICDKNGNKNHMLLKRHLCSVQKALHQQASIYYIIFQRINSMLISDERRKNKEPRNQQQQQRNTNEERM